MFMCFVSPNIFSLGSVGNGCPNGFPNTENAHARGPQGTDCSLGPHWTRISVLPIVFRGDSKHPVAWRRVSWPSKDFKTKHNIFESKTDFGLSEIENSTSQLFVNF